MSATTFLKLIPAAPGCRLVLLWEDDPKNPDISYEPVIAWVETEDRPGELMPVCDDGEGFRPVFVDVGSIYFHVLHAGQEINLNDEDRGWRGRIETWRKARLAKEALR